VDVRWLVIVSFLEFLLMNLIQADPGLINTGHDTANFI